MAKAGGARHCTAYAGQPLPTATNNFWVASSFLIGLLALMGAGRQQEAAAQDLVFTVTTIQDVSDAPFDTWLGILASSLLPNGTAGAFLGTVPADVVETTCQDIEGGQLNFDIQVTVQGNTESHQIQIQNTGGCDASSASPKGVEMVYIDETGASTAIICDENAYDYGCQIYMTGDDVTDYYNGALSNQAMQVKEGGHRKLLSAGCFIAGAATGTVLTTATAVEACGGTGILYLACIGTASVAGFIGGALVGCKVMAGAGCFPGESLAMLKSGQYKPMSELEIGDQVATWRDNSDIKFDSIYALGHVDGDSNGLYFDITLVPTGLGSNGTVDIKRNQNLQLTPGHFIPTLSGEGKLVYKRALDINVGDQMWAVVSFEENSISVFTVQEISMSVKKGLYNPFTLGGSIIVNGVVASTHSEWFLDDTFGHMGIAHHWLPLAYQVVLFPIRLIFRTLPLVQYRRLYSYIDQNLDISTFGTRHGGLIASLWLGMSFLLGAALIFQLFIARGVKKDTKSTKSPHY